MRKKPTAAAMTIYALGCVVFSIGVKFFIDAQLGVDPLNCMVIGIVHLIDRPAVQIGTVSTLVTAFFLGLWMVWNRSWPPLTPLLTMALVGYLIDLWNVVHLERLYDGAVSHPCLLIVGLTCDAYASAMIIMSGIGIRVMDLVAITMVRKLGLPFVACKFSLELGFISAGFLLGGPVGVGTVAFLGIVGLLIQPFMWINARILRMRNLGLPEMASA